MWFYSFAELWQGPGKNKQKICGHVFNAHLLLNIHNCDKELKDVCWVAYSAINISVHMYSHTITLDSKTQMLILLIQLNAESPHEHYDKGIKPPIIPHPLLLLFISHIFHSQPSRFPRIFFWFIVGYSWTLETADAPS